MIVYVSQAGGKEEGIAKRWVKAEGNNVVLLKGRFQMGYKMKKRKRHRVLHWGAG